jgi:3-isopropylmalate/(R)-2-methylmalate dehydratase small subunit
VYLGVAAVIAPSYGGLYFRNAFNLGLLLLTCPASELLQQQERLALDITGLGLVLPSGARIDCEPIPDFLLQMAQAGGLLAGLRQRMKPASA